MSGDVLCCSSTLQTDASSYISVKTEFKTRGRRRLFSEAVFDQCCGADLCRWQKLLLLSEGALEQLNLDIHIGYSHGTCPNCSGIDHRAMWGNGDPYVMIHKEFLFLGNVLPLSVKCVTYLFTYAKFNYFTTCLWCSAIR